MIRIPDKLARARNTLAIARSDVLDFMLMADIDDMTPDPELRKRVERLRLAHNECRAAEYAGTVGGWDAETDRELKQLRESHPGLFRDARKMTQAERYRKTGRVA